MGLHQCEAFEKTSSTTSFSRTARSICFCSGPANRSCWSSHTDTLFFDEAASNLVDKAGVGIVVVLVRRNNAAGVEDNSPG